jgi:YjbE family integral membrane protein
VVVADAWDRGAGTAADLMALLTDPEFWVRLLGIGVLNLLLSGDNALVIALAVRALPKRKRLQGQIWGAVGAVLLRLIFVGIVSVLLRIPLLQLVGGLLLVWIAVKLVRPETAGDNQVRRGSSLWEAIWIIIVADVTMSLDNVLAIAATAHGDFLLVMFGIGLSLPIVIGGAGFLALLMNRFTWIVWLGGGLLGYVAGEMLIDDPVIRRWLGDRATVLRYVVPVGIGAVITALGWWLGRSCRHAHVPENL